MTFDLKGHWIHKSNCWKFDLWKVMLVCFININICSFCKLITRKLLKISHDLWPKMLWSPQKYCWKFDLWNAYFHINCAVSNIIFGLYTFLKSMHLSNHSRYQYKISKMTFDLKDVWMLENSVKKWSLQTYFLWSHSIWNSNFRRFYLMNQL